jgi:signal transduction histidine kinase
MNTLTAFIRQHCNAIVDEWLSRAAKLPSAQVLTRLTLRDDIPAILDKLADAIDRRDETARPLEQLPEQHATLRFHEGYDLRQVVAEYRLLREVIMDLYSERGELSVESRPKMKPLMVMNEAVDRAIAEAVDQYAAERDRARETFIAMLGHDLRDPLNAILFSVNTLSERGDDPDVRTATVARIASSAKRMDRMTRDLLDFARTRLGGGFTVVPTRFDVRPLIEQTVHDIAQAHPDRAIHLHDPTTGDFHVEWDSDRIAQVIANLMSNALVHGRDPVIVEPQDEGDHVSISVRNSGEIAPGVLPRMFDAFSSDSAGKRKAGLGLGLYIVQQIAHAHGGRVQAESSGGTTTIRVTLPRHAAHMQPA